MSHKWKYPSEYLRKDGKSKKNYRKNAIEWRKNHPNKREVALIETNNRLDLLLKDVSYPSYQHMNHDIIMLFANILIGTDVNKSMNTMEECELFRGFCIMNKRLCFLNKEFRDKYDIIYRILKYKEIRKTEENINQFIDSPTKDWLPVNKILTDDCLFYVLYHRYRNWNMEIINGKSKEEIMIKMPLLKALKIERYWINTGSDRKRSIPCSSLPYLALIREFKKNPELFKKTIVNCRISFIEFYLFSCKDTIDNSQKLRHWDFLTTVVEVQIRFFIKILLE